MTFRLSRRRRLSGSKNLVKPCSQPVLISPALNLFRAGGVLALNAWYLRIWFDILVLKVHFLVLCGMAKLLVVVKSSNVPCSA